ncbi:MAG TPA: TetR/AcrR family transcriptional regulator [Ktedonobacteraceae bacterium]|jgi:AcrR family transcriptional regulator|nr:TetR/AcrR family transcriptional regulator [Ktedonobacteraceae bacterium]
MQTQDRRIRRTQQLLARALIALTLEKGYEAVTIRDITEHADVGYTTFFRHYRDKDELLKDVLDVVLEELIDLLSSPAASTNPTTIGTFLFRYVQEHSEVVRVLLGSLSLRQHLIEQTTQTTMSEHTALPGSVVPLEVAAQHIVSSTIALIEWWLRHQMPYAPERMGQIYEELISRPTSAVAFQGEV